MFDHKYLEYQVLPIPFHILRIIGLWYPKEKSSIKFIYLLLTFIVIVPSVLLLIEVFIYVIKNIYKKEFDLNAFFVLLSLIVGLYKGLSVLLNRDRIMNLIMIGFKNYYEEPRSYLVESIAENCLKKSW
jgi:hypothetical protein